MTATESRPPSALDPGVLERKRLLDPEAIRAAIIAANASAARVGVDVMDLDAMDRYRVVWRGHDGHDMASVNNNSLRRLVALIDELALTAYRAREAAGSEGAIESAGQSGVSAHDVPGPVGPPQASGCTEGGAGAAVSPLTSPQPAWRPDREAAAIDIVAQIRSAAAETFPHGPSAQDSFIAGGLWAVASLVPWASPSLATFGREIGKSHGAFVRALGEAYGSDGVFSDVVAQLSEDIGQLTKPGR